MLFKRKVKVPDSAAYVWDCRACNMTEISGALSDCPRCENPREMFGDEMSRSGLVPPQSMRDHQDLYPAGGQNSNPVNSLGFSSG